MQTQVRSVPSRPKASDIPGIWARPHGEAYYTWLVKAGTTTNATPDELHKLGVEQKPAGADGQDLRPVADNDESALARLEDAIDTVT